jgi:hypothetical protein
MNHAPIPQRAACWLVAMLALLAPLRPTEAASTTAPAARIFPETVILDGAEARQQLLAFKTDSSTNTPAGEIAKAQFVVENAAVATVDQAGNLRPVSDGTTKVRLEGTSSAAPITVTVKNASRHKTPSFHRDILPILTKSSCNTGGCHGALAGKGGFRLSLAGYDPESDHYNLVHDANGRRLEPNDPLLSLILTKSTLALPHKGGRRILPGGEDYRTLATWIVEGTPGPDPTEAALDRIEVTPNETLLRKGDSLRLLVTAHYKDGSSRDVTRWAKFASADESVAKLDDATGRIEVIGNGAGAVTAWFSSRIVIARLIAPQENQLRPETWDREPTNNPIDRAVLAQLKRLKIPPSPTCDDATFLRRAMADTLGTLPTAAEVRAFLSDPAPDKRARLIESLFSRPEFVDYWTYRFSDIFLINGSNLRPNAVKSYYTWLRSKVAQNTPWNQIVREVLVAKGDSLSEGATNFYAVHQDPETMAENVSQAFLGLSINCAKCHNHPLEKWTNDQYYAFANLFARVRAKGWGGDTRSGDGKRTLFINPDGDLIQPRTGKPQPPTPLDAAPLPMDDPQDRRETLANWLTAPDNTYFTRTIANRIWASFFGIGIVNSVDDLRTSNPASNEALLTAIAEHLAARNFDLRELMRLILNSATYQRSSAPVEGNAADQRHFSRYLPRRHMAEILNDAIASITGVPEKFDAIMMNDGSTEKTDFYPLGTRATQLYDASVRSYFLKAFGRNQREITCECERSNQPSLVQALHLSNGNTINDRLSNPTGNLTALLEMFPNNDQLIEQAFLATLSRPPNRAEHATHLAALNEATKQHSTRPGTKLGDQAATARREAAEDMLWALLTSREFLFQH